ncbi:MAG: glutamate carboxypeptidase [Thermomicrobiales bacterium]|jgi:glutamate carboxypeptidase|nr:glutamate carboxypeptidase [Thermomicrobiales bacterium]
MPEPIVSFLEDHLDEYLADLRRLAGIDSGTDDKAGVDAVQGWLEERLRAAGFSVERNRQEQWGDDLIARRHGTGRAKVMLLGHADTVYPKGTAAARPVTLVGDRLKGPGTCDMKAGILTGLYAVRALDHVGWRDYGTITFIIVSDEEIEERHSAELLKSEGPRHDAVLTLEAARENGDIVTARKATRWLTVEAHGKAAHAGVEPEKGRSATLALANVIVETFKLNGMKDGMTVNPGRIEGGTNPNVVADYAKALFDLRAWSVRDLNELTDAFRETATKPWVPDVQVVVHADGGAGMPAMERTPGTVRLEEHAIRIARELGFPLKGAKTGGGSDVSFACHAGTPGLDGLGPIGGLDHGPDEYILQSSIVPRTALLAKLLTAIGEDEGFGHA